jgi:hypothetical protein
MKASIFRIAGACVFALIVSLWLPFPAHAGPMDTAQFCQLGSTITAVANDADTFSNAFKEGLSESGLKALWDIYGRDLDTFHAQLSGCNSMYPWNLYHMLRADYDELGGWHGWITPDIAAHDAYGALTDVDPAHLDYRGFSQIDQAAINTVRLLWQREQMPWSDPKYDGFLPGVLPEAGGTPIPTPTPSPVDPFSSLLGDPAFLSCRQIGGLGATKTLLQCVYSKHDYKAAEVVGDALHAATPSLDPKTSYLIADAFYQRGNSAKALQYAKLGYSHLHAKDKASCATSPTDCAQLRTLLVALDPTYRAKFASEDTRIKAAQAEAAREAAAAAREEAATAFSYSGSGIHSTETFYVNSEWMLEWSYDCSNFGNEGNFIVTVSGDTDAVAVNQLGSGDSGIEYMHAGGNVYLEINSECSWTVKAVNE